MFNPVSSNSPDHASAAGAGSAGAASGSLASRDVRVAQAARHQSYPLSSSDSGFAGKGEGFDSRSFSAESSQYARSEGLQHPSAARRGQPQKPYLSPVQALEHVCNRGVESLKNRWTSVLGNSVSLDTLVKFKKSTPMESSGLVDGNKYRFSPSLSYSNDPFINRAGSRPKLELPSLTRNTQLLIAEQYSNKYGVEILFVNENPGDLDMDQIAIGLFSALSVKGKVGLVVPVAKELSAGTHSIPILFSQSETGIDAHILDSAYSTAVNRGLVDQYFPSVLVDIMSAYHGLEVRAYHDTTGRQKEHAGCHADALEVLKDGLREAYPGERPVTVEHGTTKVKDAMMKTTQTSGFWKSQDIDKNEIYSSKNRTIQEHIDNHSITIEQPLKFTPLLDDLDTEVVRAAAEAMSPDDGRGVAYVMEDSGFTVSADKTVNMFLRGKSISYIDRAVAEAFGKTREQFFDQINSISLARTLG